MARRYEDHRMSYIGIADCVYTEIKGALVDKPDMALDVHIARQSVQLGRFSVGEAMTNLKNSGLINRDYWNATEHDQVLVESIEGCLKRIKNGNCINYPV